MFTYLLFFFFFSLFVLLFVCFDTSKPPYGFFKATRLVWDTCCYRLFAVLSLTVLTCTVDGENYSFVGFDWSGPRLLCLVTRVNFVFVSHFQFHYSSRDREACMDGAFGFQPLAR